MKNFLIVFLLFLSSACSSLKYEYGYSRSRAEAKKSEHYMEWSLAKASVIQHCSEITAIYQGHSRVVGISFDSDKYIRSVSDYLDEVLYLTDDCRPKKTTILME